uniref:Uncharacterized protein n=1 Tax=Apteryx owenii TaxID=8824 RepID=A0A8B9QHR8_APTOW
SGRTQISWSCATQCPWRSSKWEKRATTQSTRVTPLLSRTGCSVTPCLACALCVTARAGPSGSRSLSLVLRPVPGGLPLQQTGVITGRAGGATGTRQAAADSPEGWRALWGRGAGCRSRGLCCCRVLWQPCSSFASPIPKGEPGPMAPKGGKTRKKRAQVKADPEAPTPKVTTRTSKRRPRGAGSPPKPTEEKQKVVTDADEPGQGRARRRRKAAAAPASSEPEAPVKAKRSRAFARRGSGTAPAARL